MEITIVDHQDNSYTHNNYDVKIGLVTTVRTLVTTSGSMVHSWIQDIKRIHSQSLHRLIVGLDVEWRPSFTSGVESPVATIQLCVDDKCLIFQLLHADYIPNSLSEFLGNSNHNFVGVGVVADVEKLRRHYQLYVRNPVELGNLAAYKRQDQSLKNQGLQRLATYVLGLDLDKPRSVTMSWWDNRYLNYSQVKYACVDAYASSEIGKVLMAEPEPYFGFR